MTYATGIELGPTSLVLVSARPAENGMDVAAVQTLAPISDARRLSEALRFARRTGRLPRRARLVSWGLTAPSSPDDPARQPLLQPFEDAGFTIEALLTPAEALAQLAASRRRPSDEPVAWLSVNIHGAVIAIVNASEILYSRTLTWKYNPAARTGREQLLQRYVLVMHIAPELQHGIGVVRTNHGKRVETVVTCGNLPDLRSLTMPLIEELDMEVETLDSTDGLRPGRSLPTDTLADTAPVIRLATAAAVMPQAAGRLSVLPAVAAALLLIAGGWLAASALRLSSNRAPVQPVIQRDAEAPAMPFVEGPRAASPTMAPDVTPADATPTPPAVESPAPAASTGSASASGPVGGLGSAAVSQMPQRSLHFRLPAVPPVTSILVDGGRRMALIGGEIVTVGDFVGLRVVVRIDHRSVVLRDPSGNEITVLLSDRQSDGVKLRPFAGYGRSPGTRTQAAR